MNRIPVFLADLTHTALGISNLTFPLGTAFVASYADSKLGDTFEFHLFKFPEELAEAILAQRPRVIGFSNYAWNATLAYRIATWAKQNFPDTITVFGGPNSPILNDEKRQYLSARPNIDFCIQNEGEIGFVELLKELQECDYDLETIHRHRRAIGNCSYLAGESLISGGVARVLNVNEIPSPYLTGMLDKFFDHPLAPMIETTRGCPFSCSFCADGLALKNRVVRFHHERTRDELEYICAHIKDVEELIITDLNFGMYKQDRQTAEYIAALQAKHQWPRIVMASAGKNQPERIMETATLLKGSWVIGSAVQSTDEAVLKNIKRGNISTDAYRQFIKYANRQSDDALSYTEIILALPGDTKEKHFKSLRAGIDNKVSSLRMLQAMLLVDTHMASKETREKFELLTKFRIIPGNIGIYECDGEAIPVAEIEEIIVGSKDMPFEDYVSCRIMNLLVETYINNGLFEEFFSALWAMEVSAFDVLVHLHGNPWLHLPRMTEIIESFTRETVDGLFDSLEEAEVFALKPENMEKFLTGQLGGNELLEHRALLYLELEEIADVLMNAVYSFLEREGLWSDDIDKFLNNLMSFIICKKRRVDDNSGTIAGTFDFDFKALSANGFNTNPRHVKATEKSVELNFFHTPDQKKYIKNALSLYMNHTGGISRMIQRSNLKMMYRNFEYA